MNESARRPVIRRVPRGVDWQQPTAVRSVLDHIAPDAIELRHREYLVSGRVYARHLAVVGFPATVRFGYLVRLFTGQAGVHVLQVVDPLPDGEARGVLGRSRRAARATLVDADDAADAEVGLSDVERARIKVARGEERLIRYGIYIQVTGLSRDELEQRTQSVEEQLHVLGLETIRCSFRQKAAFDAFLPVGIDPLAVHNLVDTSTVARGFFFASSSVVCTTSDSPTFFGIALNRDKTTGGPVMFDPFSLVNPHTMVLATSGAGKSYLLKYAMLQDLIWGRRYFIIDPEHEYEGIAGALGGTFVRISPGTPHRLNPFDLPLVGAELGDDVAERNVLAEKVASLAVWMEAFLSPRTSLRSAERSALETAIQETYKTCGITHDPDTHRLAPPTMEDFAPRLQAVLPELAPGLKRVTGGTLSIFDGRTNVDLDRQLVVFGLRDITEKNLLDLASLLAFERIWTYVRSRENYGDDPVTVLLDEAWNVIALTEGGRMLANTIRRARKYGLRIIVATQQVADVMTRKEDDELIGRTIASNCHTAFLLQMKPHEADLARSAFELTNGEREFLGNCGRREGHSECLLVMGKERTGLQVLKAPEMIHQMIRSKDASEGGGGGHPRS